MNSSHIKEGVSNKFKIIWTEWKWNAIYQNLKSTANVYRKYIPVNIITGNKERWITITWNSTLRK